MSHNPSLIFAPDEKILVLTREHKIILFAKLLVWAALSAIPFIVDVILDSIYGEFGNELVLGVWAIIKNLYFLLSLLALMMIITLYLLNIHVVTNKRIIDSDQLSLIRHHTTETHISKVQDVAANLIGLFAQIFNYGDVAIQSAGDIAKITFENVPDPKRIKRIVLDAHYASLPAPPPNPLTI